MKPYEKPTKKNLYDSRDGVCKSCGVKAVNGICERHTMECGLCFGFGAVPKSVYKAFYGKTFAHRTLYSGATHELDELKEWFCKKIDTLASYGCPSCWSDDHNCTCAEDKERMKSDLIEELSNKI